jgi:hypothetical protein
MARTPKRRRRPAKEELRPTAGVAWYDRDQWERVRGLAADPELLEVSYESWVAMAERSVRELEAAGMIIKRVPVNAVALESWCRARGLPINSSARARFAADELRRLHG